MANNKFETWLLSGSFILIIAMSLGSMLLSYKIYEQEIVFEINNKYEPIKQESMVEDGDMADFFVVARRFANNHNYSDDYNCVNYTDDLYRIIEELGLSTNIEKVRGCSEEGMTGECHRWLKITMDFEPQSYTIKDYSDEYFYQEIIGECNENHCVIKND